ncbi:alpha/beta fold hydrolase [Paraburkholderia megapolitana]|uniref:Pimeloyl-ACP methyl ester carboxylesterase n=1 Tax=Paraburkholderia megapolitana TaxID=420953 RepID=A0A1I3DXY5_9BURK|nr:alpha/beta hydrolase [Paraburkholderia megapolitana]QDQ81951.1 alpha/beta hydrolase [Paraburkholderia megapolitana]SFH91545.1 Pimeloyl-ACP methyl ester carboxylesterase [Paraburkholderia megapolitana]
MPYVEAGEGELLLFVHGSLCDYRYWQPQLAGLSARYRCVAVSLTHYWPVTDTPTDLPFSWSDHAGELAEFIERFGAGPAHVVGHSRGGCVAFHFARRHSQWLRTLTLADPGGPLQIAGRTPAKLPETANALRARAAQLIETGEVDAGLQLFVDSVSRPGFWAKSTTAFRTMATDNAHTLARQFRDPLPAYTPEDAAEIRCPLLLIDGEKSPDMFRRTATALATWCPDARRETVRGASHGMNLAHPAAFNRYIDTFIREVGSAPAVTAADR